jgi:type II secretory pathway component PulM
MSASSLGIQRWWRALAGRERILVLAALVLATLTLTQLLAKGIGGGIGGLREGVAARREAVAIARQLAAAPDLAVAGEPLLASAERAARGAGLGAALKRLAQDDDGKVRVRLEGAPFGAFAGWLGAVQRSSGARIEALLIARGQASGLVDVTLTLVPAG